MASTNKLTINPSIRNAQTRREYWDKKHEETKEMWAKRFLSASKRGLTIKEMAAIYDVTPACIYNWRNIFRREPGGNLLTELLHGKVEDATFVTGQSSATISAEDGVIIVKSERWFTIRRKDVTVVLPMDVKGDVTLAAVKALFDMKP